MADVKISELPAGVALSVADILAAVQSGATRKVTAAQVRDHVAGAIAGFALSNGYVAASVAGNALTIAIKTLAGADPSAADPVVIRIRDATVSSGKPTALSLTAATSLVISSGSTIGTNNFSRIRLWIVGFNDGGTFRLGVINCKDSGAGPIKLDETAVASSTAEGGAGGADSAGVFYTGTAVSSKPFRILGYLEWTANLTTAGTWDTAPQIAQLMGPGVKKPGDVVQVRSGNYTTAAPSSAEVPTDDTIPASGEGTQTATVSMTKMSAVNPVEFEAHFNAFAASAFTATASIFDPDGNNRACGQISGPAGVPQSGYIRGMLGFGNTANDGTWQLRVGYSSVSAATTIYFNGNASGRLYGGALAHSIVVREIMA